MNWKDINKEKRIETLSVLALAVLVIKSIVSDNWEWSVSNFDLIAIVLLIIGLFVNSLGKGITFLWLKLSEGMGFVMSKVILGLFFYIFLFPFSLLHKIFNKDNLNINSGKSSYFHERNHKYSKSDLDNIW